MRLNIEKSDQDKFGIYQIKNTITQRLYIGQTRDRFIERYWNHSWKLRKNTHDNKHLQRSFNKYGDDNFEFTIIEIVDNPLLLDDLERYYISELSKSNLLYNIQLGGQDSPMKGVKMPQSTKDKISAKNKIALKGKKQSIDTITKRKEKLKGKTQWKRCTLDYDTAAFIKSKLIEGMRPIDISEIYGIEYKVVNNIYSSNTYKSVEFEGWEEFYNNKPKLRNMREGKLKKLTKEDITTVNAMIKEGISKSEIARRLGVSRNTLYSYL